MTTLHLINAAPGISDLVDRCFAAAIPGDAIVFYEAGTLSAASLGAKSRPTGVKVFAHRRDADALHVTERIGAGIELIDDAQLVSLVVACERSVSWL